MSPDMYQENGRKVQVAPCCGTKMQTMSSALRQPGFGQAPSPATWAYPASQARRYFLFVSSPGIDVRLTYGAVRILMETGA